MDEADKPIVLISNDNQRIEISKKVAQGSNFIKNDIESFPDHTEYPLAIKGELLTKIKEYLEHHQTEEAKVIPTPLPDGDLKKYVTDFDFKFIDLDPNTVAELLLAANTLDIQPLLTLTAAKIASFMKGKTTEEMRAIFKIENDFTPEEYKRYQEENQWCLENFSS